MGKKKKHKKKPIKWKTLAMQALIDLIIGTILNSNRKTIKLSITVGEAHHLFKIYHKPIAK